MTYLLAALFFTLALLGALVALHMIVLQSWDEIVLALRGELGLRPPVPRALRPEQARFHGRAAS